MAGECANNRGSVLCARLPGMTRPSQPSLQDLHPTGDFTDQRTRADLDLRPLANGAIAPTEALLALARLLGRQAARAFLSGAGEGTACSHLAGDPTDGRPQNPARISPQADPPSDAF
jgi:hypothetical protein